MTDWLATRGPFRITCDPDAVDLDAVHAALATSYWAAGIPREIVAKAIAGSIPFSLFDAERQVGFARVITDRATFAYLADVYVLEHLRNQGLGLWFVRALMRHPDLQALRRFHLVTRNAHTLYARAGFTPVAHPERHMEIVRANPYGAPASIPSPEPEHG